MKLIVFLNFIFTQYSAQAEDSCRALLETSLRAAKQSSSLSREDSYRLAAIIRNQAANIFDDSVSGEINIFWNESSDRYVSNYTAKKTGSKISLVYDNHAFIIGYKVINNKKPIYHCDQYAILNLKTENKIKHAKD